MKTCLIKQPAGIGDIFFCMKIAEHTAAKYNCDKVIWPVNTVYSFVQDYMRSYCDIEFPNEQEDFPYKNVYNSGERNSIANDDYVFLPLQTADSLIRKCKCHNSAFAFNHIKYDFVDMNYNDWLMYFNFNRNEERELALCDNLDIDLSEPYVLVNRNYGTFPHYLRREDILERSEIKQIEMNFYDDVNIFDWITIALNACEIHTVETSLLYILEKLQLKNVTVYSRYNYANDDFVYIRDLFSDEWTYVK